MGHTPIPVLNQVKDGWKVDFGEFDNTWKGWRVPCDGFMVPMGGASHSSLRIYRVSGDLPIYRAESYDEIGRQESAGKATFIGYGNGSWATPEQTSLLTAGVIFRVKKGEYYVEHSQGGYIYFWKD